MHAAEMESFGGGTLYCSSALSLMMSFFSYLLLFYTYNNASCLVKELGQYRVPVVRIVLVSRMVGIRPSLPRYVCPQWTPFTSRLPFS